MIDFIKLVENILEEQGKTKQDLFDNNVVSENTFFKYRQRFPSLKTVIKISNYLNVSLDYLFEFSNENHFKEYDIDNLKFYVNLISFINNKKISARKFCKDLGYAKDNILRWKNGIQPTIQRLLEMTEYFGCSIDDLIM
ncbi:MAG: helix-turn-helix domain-containing protein [Christensenellales bacterium]